MLHLIRRFDQILVVKVVRSHGSACVELVVTRLVAAEQQIAVRRGSKAKNTRIGLPCGRNSFMFGCREPLTVSRVRSPQQVAELFQIPHRSLDPSLVLHRQTTVPIGELVRAFHPVRHSANIASHPYCVKSMLGFGAASGGRRLQFGRGRRGSGWLRRLGWRSRWRALLRSGIRRCR